MNSRHSKMTPTPGHTLRAGLLLLVYLCGALPVWAADVLLVGAEDSSGVQAFTRTLARQRPEDNVRFVPLANLPAPSELPTGTRLIVLDPPGLDWRLQDAQGPATLVLRISRLQAHQRLDTTTRPQLSLLWSDPPLNRQLRLARETLAQARRVGVLYGNESAFLLKELRQAAQPLGLDDPELYNPKTAKNLLLSSYIRQLPLIGPNAGFVKAGSLTSSYSDQQDWLQTLDTLLDRPPSSWPRSLYPQRFKVLSNPQVARSLGIEEIDEQSVATRLAAGESRP